MTDTTNHLPPQSLEAEEAIIGAMLLSPVAVDKAEQCGLQAEHFYRDSHRIIFAAIRDLAERDAEVDGTTVVLYLKAKRMLTAAGGTAAVLTLADKMPAVANARSYAREVVDQAVLRSLVSTGHSIASLGYEHPDNPAALVAKAGQMVDELTEGGSAAARVGITTAADELQPFVDAMEERWKLGAEFSGLTTGLAVLNDRTGGLRPGELTIIAGRPAMGKSALAAGIAEHLVFGCAADVYSVNLEMRERQQIGRLMARAGTVPLRAARGLPTEAEVESAAKAVQSLHESAKRLHMDRATDLTVAQIRQRARKLQRSLKRKGRSLGLIVVDYLQLITPPPGERNETAALTLISRGLKAMALELGVHVIALSQLNRSVEDRTPPVPRLSDLRGSGSIEQDADMVMFLYRPEYYLGENTPVDMVGKAEVIAAKLREGEPGTDALRWEGSRVRFTDWDGPKFVVGGGSSARRNAA